jgi:flagellar hook-basal body complex protein FliE
MNDLTISKLQSLLPKSDAVEPQSLNDASKTPFSDYIKQSLKAVNNQMLDADQSIEDFVTGKNQDIHHTMLSMQKASVSFELVMQVRNKIITAYDEIRKMAI